MERESLIERALGRLRGRGSAAGAATPRPRALDGDPPPPDPENPLGGEQLSLGDLNDGGRREAARARLRALREGAPAGPSLQGHGHGHGLGRGRGSGAVGLRTTSIGGGGGGPSSGGRGPDSFGERIAALAHRARLGVAAAGSAASHRWHELPVIARQRIAAAAIVVAVLVIVVLVLIPAAPCGAPGGDSCPADDDAIALVPEDAVAYAHVDIDPDSEQFAAFSSFSGRLPMLGGMLLRSLTDVGGKSSDFATEIRPWAGDQAAFAVLPAGVGLDRVTMIEADDAGGASDFAAGVLGPRASEREVGGVDVSVSPRGQAAALLDGFLLIGDEAAVTEMIEGDDAGSLETAGVAAGIDDLPEDRFAYAYLSGDGARALLRTPGASSLDTFVSSGSATSVTAALSFDDEVAKITVRSDLDPDLAEDHPAFFSALPEFTPALDSDVGPDALAYLGLGDPGSSVESLLDRARSSAPALAKAFGRADRDLRNAGGVGISEDVLPLLGDEAALSIEPVAGDQVSQTPGVLAPAGTPYVSLIADGVDSKAAAEDLAGLQDPLVEALAPRGGEAAGQVSVFEPLQIAGTEAQTLTVSPNLELTYATYDDRLVAATKPIGVAQARAGGDGLADSDDYQEVTAGMPSAVSAIAYLDLRDLLALGEQVGLGADPAYARLAPDLRSLRALAIAVDDSGDGVRTDLNLSVGDAPEPDPSADEVGGE